MSPAMMAERCDSESDIPIPESNSQSVPNPSPTPPQPSSAPIASPSSLPVFSPRRHTTDSGNRLEVDGSHGSTSVNNIMHSPHTGRAKPEGVTFCMPLSEDDTAPFGTPMSTTSGAGRSLLRHNHQHPPASAPNECPVTNNCSALLSIPNFSNSDGNRSSLILSGSNKKAGTNSAILCAENPPQNPPLARKVSVTQDPRILPNLYIRTKLEALIEKMQDPSIAIEVRNRKNFLKTIPSVFTSHALIAWLERHLQIMDHVEAIHVASMLSAMGYLFCIDDHVLAVRNENQLMRFQTPWLYPGVGSLEAEEVDYAVYLCKRTMRNKTRMELTDFEAERLARLQSYFYHKWEFVYMKAEAEVKVDKKRRDKNESYVLESQERAFWNFHRPPPGTVNMTEVDMRKLCCAKRPKKDPIRPPRYPLSSNAVVTSLVNTLDAWPLMDRVVKLRNALARPRIKVSKAIENIQNFYEQYCEFDLLLNAASTTQSGGPGVAPGGMAPSNNSGNSSVNNPLANNSDMRLSPSTTNSPAHQSQGNQSAATSASLSTHCLQHTMPTVITAAAASPQSLPNSGNMPNGDSANNPSSNSSNNPWISDNQAYWDGERRLRDLPIRRVKRWGFRIHELLRDPVGHEEFFRWLEKEFSAENLRFYEACQDLKAAPLRELNERINKIFEQFFSSNATEPLNVDSRVAESVRSRVARISNSGAVSTTLSHEDRYCFEEAEEHIFNLMKNDSYSRYLRSDMYKDLVSGQKKKSKKRFVTPSLDNVRPKMGSGQGNTAPTDVVLGSGGE